MSTPAAENVLQEPRVAAGARARPRHRKALAAVALALAALYGAHLLAIRLIRLHIYDSGFLVSEQAGLTTHAQLRGRAGWTGAEEELRRLLVPMVEAEAFDDDARDWSNIFGMYPLGMVVFDANGDGRLDVYFGQDGQNWTRPTDEKGVLLDEPRYQHNGLYLNQGNDAQGFPVLTQVGELARSNDTYVREELLVEGFLFPREGAADSTARWGRQSLVAVAADVNADGRCDLLVGNQMPGAFWSVPETQHFLWPLISPDGRKPRHHKQATAGLARAFIDYQPRMNLEDRRESARGTEPFGANSLYLNEGDKDGDGLPEWRDASRETGFEGFRTSIAIAVADVDLDGDLDVFVANTMDPDFMPIGSKYWAGGANELYLNQLAETGELRFVERGAEMDVDGVYDEDYPMPDFYKLRRIPWLPPEYSFLFLKYVPYRPGYLVIDGQEAEHGQASWAATFQDVDEDGYPDVWVANDWGYLRLYRNRGGKGFTRESHTAGHTSGNWMSLTPADYDGDLEEDLFAGNLGGAIFSHAFAGTDPFDLFDPEIGTATASAMFVNGMHDTRHVVIDGADHRARLRASVRHSAVLPPDASLPNNIRELDTLPNGLPFDPDSLDPYEFTWGSTAFDVQNDGAMDLYYVGTLYGRGGGLSTILGTGPGRLLVGSDSPEPGVRFVDLTVEHHVLNILELRYDRLESAGYVYRRAPTKNWDKRDMVYSYDRSTWTQQGPSIQQKIANHDLIQTAESGRGAIAADLNGDGFEDLLVRNNGGYDSRASTASNLKAMIDGRPQVLPAHSYHFPVPTQYEPGSTRLFVNRYRDNNWLAVRLVDVSAGSFNRDAIGARVIVNGRFLRVLRAGEGSFVSNRLTPLHFGLGRESATSIVVHWPDRARTVTRSEVDSLARGTLTIDKDRGVVGWAPAEAAPEPRPSGPTRIAEGAASAGRGSGDPDRDGAAARPQALRR